MSTITITRTSNAPVPAFVQVVALLAETILSSISNSKSTYEIDNSIPENWNSLLLRRLGNIRSSRASLICDVWPEERAFDDAVVFIGKIQRSLIGSPSIGLADDGEVNFLWDYGGVHIDLGFYGTGTFSYYARDLEGNEYFGDDTSSDKLPDDLAEILKIATFG